MQAERRYKPLDLSILERNKLHLAIDAGIAKLARLASEVGQAGHMDMADKLLAEQAPLIAIRDRLWVEED